MILKFGKYKGKDLSQVPTEYLQWLIENTDTSDPKYAISNKQMVNACHDVINSRSDVGSYGPSPSKQGLPTIQLQNGGKEAMIKSIQALIDDLFKHAAKMQKMVDEYQPDGTMITRKTDHLVV